MRPIDNRTPFSVELVSMLDTSGREVRVLVVVATFEGQGPELSIAATQEPVCFGDEHRGDPGLSSVVRESDVCPPKLLVDVIVDGCAYAPGGVPAEAVTVSLAIGDIRKELRVVGDRPSAGSIVPFRKLPIVYERALGGVGPVSPGKVGPISRANPIGIGAGGALPVDPDVRTVVPNVEHVSSQVRDRPAGFGVIGRGWSPRIELAGTFDAEWLRSQWPLAPKDLDRRHFQAAPQDQQSQTIEGGEPVRLVNLTPNGVWEFVLPRLSVPIFTIRESGPGTLAVRLDTVYIRPETHRVVLCHRAVVEDCRGADEPRELVAGHVTSAWLQARCSGRYYFDPGDTRGERRDMPLYS